MCIRHLGSITLSVLAIVGALFVAGCARVPATCNDGEIAVFDTASGAWVCGTRGFVLLDNNGAEIGPVVSYSQMPEAVVVTLPDSTNTPRTVLLGSNGKRLSAMLFSTVYFTQPGCAGDPFVQAAPELPRLAPLYELAGIVPATGPDRLYVVDQSAALTPTLVSSRIAGTCHAQGPTNPTAEFYRLDLLSADLQALYPAPHTLQPH